jgi:tetratricopeptide (TPR) repeat protein
MRLLPLALLLAAWQAAAAQEPKPAAAAAPLSPAVIEKMGQGDRAFLERDFRNALFAYMDAAYLAPTSAVPRVKLGRTYLAMRYPARAIEQAEKALAMDPDNADAKKLIEEARNAPGSTSPAAPQTAAKPAPATSAPRVFRFVPDADAPPAPAPAAAPPAPAPPARAASAAGGRAEPPPASAARPSAAPTSPPVPDPVRVAAVAPVPVRAPGPESAAPQPQGATAAQRYREGLDHIRDREFEKAIASLSDAVALDPRLAVAYAARASARFALGGYREAADDYRTAIGLDAKLATPLYGLAECLRALGQRKEAAEMYRRYAESQAPDVRDDLRTLASRRVQELK